LGALPLFILFLIVITSSDITFLNFHPFKVFLIDTNARRQEFHP